ncbi:hypothetical protein [Bradyrhizobium sp. 76]|uniref:hypothetical protein n=1 Tax=Bradyrhizobium sp. 76 TaxID=2782680 RepID=UPI001FFC26EA|nr:hypothetical protein [Bradyrhizobium sp. 76]MCK1409484.1 hypothetical protein [Bradyrhizobium sp. 76]
MIWKNYVFRRGPEVEDLWDQILADRKKSSRKFNLLYISGAGFDARAAIVMSKYVERVRESGCEVQNAQLLLISFSSYQMSEELKAQTRKNKSELEECFSEIGSCHSITFGRSSVGEDEVSATIGLRQVADDVLRFVDSQTDIVLDVSSLPRIAYLTVLLSLLAKLLPTCKDGSELAANGTSLQVLVGEDAALDSLISSEDPSNDLVLIPGYSEALQSEALRDLPLVWLPILGENRLAQVRKIEEVIPSDAEICPVLPYPSKNPRRGDMLLVEYDSILFARRETPLSNIMYANEAHPFQMYRQLLGAMERYRNTLKIVGGCRLVVTPLASKLMTIGSALACFEMKMISADRVSSVAIPYAEPRRYVANIDSLLASRPEISALLLTGDAYG